MADVLIAGGGLTGSALAVQLGRLGLTVELFERFEFPKEKPCGEGLMPAGVAALVKLGLAGAVPGAPFLGIRYHCAGRVIEGRFPPANGVPCAGRGFRRRDLDQALFMAAQSTPGVTAHCGARVEAPRIENGRVTGLLVDGEVRRGRLVIAADGAQSRLRHMLGLDIPLRYKRVGMRAHFRLAPGQLPGEWVNVHLGSGFELYVTPLPRGELLVAALAHADALSGPVETQFRRWCAEESALAARLQGAEQVSELQVTSPLSCRARRRVLPGLVLMGDAAGSTDPITGGGMTQALLTAELLADFAAGGIGDADGWLPDFDRRRESLLRDYRRLTAAMLWASEHPVVITGVFQVLRLWPRLFTHLLGVTGGVRRLSGGRAKRSFALRFFELLEP